MNNICMISGLSGIIEVCASHPLDTIKTKIQDNELKNIKMNIYQTIKNIYKTNGLSGFYTGITSRLIGIIPMRTIYWTSMDYSNKIIENKNDYIKYIFPALFIGTCQTIIDNPIEVIKIKLMTSDDKKINYNNLFKGFTPTLTRNIVFCFFVNNSIRINNENKFMAAGIGGLVGSIISHPFDIIKTEMQRCNGNKENKNFILLLKNYILNNPKLLFKGVCVRSLLSMVNMSIGFTFFNCLYTNNC